jgi:hypothetical protein
MSDSVANLKFAHAIAELIDLPDHVIAHHERRPEDADNANDATRISLNGHSMLLLFLPSRSIVTFERSK